MYYTPRQFSTKISHTFGHFELPPFKIWSRKAIKSSETSSGATSDGSATDNTSATSDGSAANNGSAASCQKSG
jgi:hypothetical protein